MTINIHKFIRQFNKEYDFLYEHRDRVAGYDEAVSAFDSFVASGENAKQFVRDFVLFRGDFVSSDREAAAFMFALEALTGYGSGIYG